MIDPVDAMLAVIGMSPIVTHEIEQISEEKWLRARDLEFEINKRAHELVTGGLADVPTPDPPRAPYMRTLRDLTTPYKPGQVERMLDSLPPQMDSLRGQFLMAAQKAFMYLGSQLPRQAASGAAGWTQLRPPERLFDRFLSQMLVLDDPLSVFPLAAAGRLLASQVGTLRAVLPTVLDHMQAATRRELDAARARNPMFQLPYKVDVGTQRLLGKDVTSAGLRRLLAAPPPQPPQPQQQGNAASAQVPLQLMTRPQRTENLG